MPSTYAHRRFGADVLVQLPRELREKITPYRPLYDMGLHGPDLMFYYRALQSNPVNRLGNAMHDEPGRKFFDPARRVVHEEAAREAARQAAHRRLVIRLTCVGAFSALVIALAVVLIRKLHKAGRC